MALRGLTAKTFQGTALYLNNVIREPEIADKVYGYTPDEVHACVRSFDYLLQEGDALRLTDPDIMLQVESALLPNGLDNTPYERRDELSQLLTEWRDVLSAHLRGEREKAIPRKLRDICGLCVIMWVALRYRELNLGKA